MNYSYKCEHEMLEDKPEEKTPEYHLWLAVVDRAIYDYATFADWVCQRQTYETKNSKIGRPKTVEIRMIREYEVLRWFLFEDPAEEYNLAWIMEHVFTGGDQLKHKIRKRCEKAHETNLAVYAQLPRLTRFLSLYEQKTGRVVVPKSVDEIDITTYAKPRARRH
jgi:hypothetical protein